MTASETRYGTFQFLQLPYEIREKIYLSLFADHQLDHSSKSVNVRKPRRTVVVSTSVSHSPKIPCYNLLLTCHQCLDEGLPFYYGESSILGWDPAIDKYLSKRRFPEAATSNVPMVCKYARRLIVSPMLFTNGIASIKPDICERAKSLKEVLIKLPEREWYHNPRLARFKSANTRPTDTELAIFHAGSQGTNGAFTFYKYGLRYRTQLGNQQKAEDHLVALMHACSKVRFLARIPVQYVVNDTTVFEICEYDLRSLQLQERKTVSKRELDAEEFPEPAPSVYMRRFM